MHFSPGGSGSSSSPSGRTAAYKPSRSKDSPSASSGSLSVPSTSPSPPVATPSGSTVSPACLYTVSVASFSIGSFPFRLERVGDVHASGGMSSSSVVLWGGLARLRLDSTSGIPSSLI
eukprot:1708794-Pyramimonas_sp.AAC.1